MWVIHYHVYPTPADHLPKLHARLRLHTVGRWSVHGETNLMTDNEFPLARPRLYSLSE